MIAMKSNFLLAFLLVNAFVGLTQASIVPPVKVDHSSSEDDVLRTKEENVAVVPKMKDSFAACILLMDDNHRTIEWLAYHYYTLPLRRVIVMTDPRSKTSPLPILQRWEKYIKFDLWSESDIFSEEELEDRKYGNMPILSEELKNRKDNNMIQLHRSRQRAFNVKCMQTLREEGATWTVMTDVDEYLHINPRAWNPSESLFQKHITPIPIDRPGSVIEMLNKVDLDDERFHAQRWKSCIPVSRNQFVAIESSTDEVNMLFPKELEPSIQAHDFDTFRWRYSGVDKITARNGLLPGKTIVDVSSIPGSEMWRLRGNPHSPIDKLCNDGNVWLNTSETLFVADHMLGSLESFAARDDARFVDRVLSWEYRKSAEEKHISDEVRPWLSGFVKEMGMKESRRLLAYVGQVQTQTFELPRCSINFFGLTRSFTTMALPSIVQNILLPNANYKCDIVVHYYKINHDAPGRFNRGGSIDPDAVNALIGATKVIAAHVGISPPSVIIKGETKAEFLIKHGDLVKHFQTALDPVSGNLKYFPWADASYKSVKQIENIVMQWNSIQSAWSLMESYAENHRFEYKRVAFFRSDAFYALPVDIFKVDKDTYDYSNRYAVIPGFARYPANDRMFYGPVDAVRVWATQRFTRLDHHIATYEPIGYGMHSERYIDHEILPAIVNETGYEVVENVDICFYRTRAGDSVMITDCSDSKGGIVRGIEEIDQVALVENMVHRACEEYSLDTSGRRKELSCDESSSRLSIRRLQDDTSAPTPPPTISPAPSAFNTNKTLDTSLTPTTLTPTTSTPPTVTASSNPSLTPTTSTPPTVTASSNPSLTPTTSTPPTVTASSNPSLTPTTSQAPTVTASSNPSLTPTTSQAPTVTASSNPSLTPTSSPPPTISQAPTFTPTTSTPPTTSQAPTVTASSNPSLTPTTSTPPSVTASSNPSLTPTTSTPPSVTASSNPSLTPTISTLPTITASSGPSLTPTISTLPTISASSNPSLTPTTSIPPTITGSSNPSLTPTTSIPPTITASSNPSLTVFSNPSNPLFENEVFLPAK